jgi:hypothetical protein
MPRHKGLIAGLLSVLAGLLVSFAHADDDYDSRVRIVRLSYVEGQVKVAHRQGIGYENATMNVPVVEGDQIRTTNNGWAEIQLEDGSTVRVAPESQVTFSALGRYSEGGTITEVDLDQGEAEFKVLAHDNSSFRVNVRQRMIDLKHSSRFRVTTTNSDPLELVVWKGEVSVVNPDDSEEVAVRKKETFLLDPLDFGRYDLEQTAQADSLDQWVEQREDYISSYNSNVHSYAQSPYLYGVSDLNYYGSYVDVPNYGYCWRPYGVNVGWDPFVNGYWTYSPGFGNVWVSAYPWGWMPYRYGRWILVGGYGWIWQPGLWNRWASAPRLVNPPTGFRPPVPPVAGTRVAAPVPYDGGPARLTVRGPVQNMDGGPAKLTVENPLTTTPGRRGRSVITNESQAPTQTQPPPTAKSEVPNRHAPVNSEVPNHQIPLPGARTEQGGDRDRFHSGPSMEMQTARPMPGGPLQNRVVNTPPPTPARTITPPPPAPVHVSPPPQVVSRPSPPPAPAPSAAPRSFTPPAASVSHGGDGLGRGRQR